jgi:hypothetical protein
MATRRWSWIVLALAALACSKSKPGTPAGQGAPPVTGSSTADGGAGAGGALPTVAPSGPIVPLMASVRSDAQSKLAGWIGVLDVGDLTLYDIDLTVDPEQGSFTATEKIDYDNRTGAPLSSIALRVYGNAFGKLGEPPPVTLESASVAGRPVAPTHPGPTTWEVALPAPLAPNARLALEVRFTGQAPKQEAGQTGMLRQGVDMLKDLFGLGGSGIEGYGILSVGDGIVSLASWYPAVGRWLPDERRFDTQEPSGIGDVGTEELANYRVRVRVAGPAVVASSGVRVDSSPTPTDQTYGGVALRDFTVLVSRDYVVASRNVGETRVSAYVPKGREPFAERILDYAAAALELYERRFGPYTLTELDVAAAPLIGGAGGVEFPGIVTVATMLMQDLSESFGALIPAGMDRLPILDEMVEFVVVHEVAHQWWNGMIGSDSVRHPFIDEGMAQYSSVLYFEDRYGAARAQTASDRNVKLNYLLYRRLGNPDGPVDRATGDFSGPLEYAALVYGKGPFYWPAVRRAIGDEKFWAVLGRYYDTYLYKTAEPEAFARLAGELAGDRTDEMLALHRRWFLETHGDEDLGQASFQQLLQMIVGDMPQLQQLLQGGGADGGSADLTQLMQLLQASGGADGGAPDLTQLMQLLQASGGADGGSADGTGLLMPGADGGGMTEMLAMARQVLAPLAAQDPNIAKLLDLLGRVERGEQVTLEELLPVVQAALQSLLGTLGGVDGGGDLAQLGGLMGLFLQGPPAAGQPGGPGQPAVSPDAGLPPP